MKRQETKVLPAALPPHKISRFLSISNQYQTNLLDPELLWLYAKAVVIFSLDIKILNATLTDVLSMCRKETLLSMRFPPLTRSSRRAIRVPLRALQ
jgi:hypothetical protein